MQKRKKMNGVAYALYNGAEVLISYVTETMARSALEHREGIDKVNSREVYGELDED